MWCRSPRSRVGDLVAEDYNLLNPVDYWQQIGQFWEATLTEGPQAGLDVISDIYVEHVATGAMFFPVY